jgi:hypothetical protein
VSEFRQWLIRLLGGKVEICKHRWKVLIEHYPRYAWDKWICTHCNVAKDFPHDEPPVPIKTEICNLGDVHIVNGK